MSYSPARLHLVDDDRVGAPQQRRAARGVISPRMRTARPGPGKRLPDDELLVEAEVAPEHAHFVLEELPQRLDELESHPLRQPADVVMALDRRRRPDDRDRLDDVGIERALREEVEVPELVAAFSRTRR